MATVTGFTAARMLDIENTTVVDGHINGSGHLILETREGTEIDAGAVVGPPGPVGPNADVGDIKSSIRTTLTGWLKMGQTVPNADTTYPSLWALPELAAWKSGSSLILPSMDDRVLQGGGTVGTVTGSNTKVLAETNLPPHVHTMAAHVHSMDAHVHSMGSHVHSMNHEHAGVYTGGQTANHTHGFSATSSVNGEHGHNIDVRQDPISGSLGSIALSNAGGVITQRSTWAAGNHSHTVSGNTGGESTTHTHYVGVPLFTGNTGGPSASNTGSGGGGNTGSSGGGNTGPGVGDSTPVNVEQAALRVNFFIKF